MLVSMCLEHVHVAAHPVPALSAPLSHFMRNERKLLGNWAVGTVLEGVNSAMFLLASFVNSDVLVLTALQRTEKIEGIFTATKHLANVLEPLSLSLHYDSR